MWLAQQQPHYTPIKGKEKNEKIGTEREKENVKTT